MKKYLLIIYFAFTAASIYPQESKSDFGFSLSGFLKTDIFFDSRQTVSAREGHFLLYPSSESFDVNNFDINDKANFNILSIQSRLTGKITAPDAFGAKTSGTLEGEFFGTADSDMNGFRLRHAYVKLDWEKVSLLVGQTWHPMFITDLVPGTVSFNTGAPFNPFSRNPQIRVTATVDKFKFIAAALTQRDFQSNGPAGFSSSYLRNNIIPNLHGQIQFGSEGNLAGIAIDYKSLKPRLVTSKNISTNETISSFAASAFFKINLRPFTIKAQGVYGGNLTDLMMLGGYAVKSIDTTSGKETYTDLKSLSGWIDVSTGKEIEFGLFAGYSKSLGASDNVVGSYYGRGINIENLFRVSPRIQFNSGKTKISTELEYTSAGYGLNDNDDKGKIVNIKSVANIRVLLAFYYFF
ncbi:hypothetical protein [Ignavibacterium sp.]|uniref:hypothetical protein n=1 Tax=Ignavibacterium sp. TaxID=2651167 RepID=UPI00307F4BEE